MSDTPDFSQFDANGLIAPIIAGALIQNMLFGVLLGVFFKFVGSSGWARARWPMRFVLVAVMLLTTASTALYAHDIFFYSLTFTPDFDVLNTGTVAEGYESLLVGVLAAIVQSVLALRASQMMRNNAVKCAYLVVIAIGSLVSLLGAIGASCSAVAFAKGAEVFDFPLQYQELFEGWMISSAITDALISLSYIILIRKNTRQGSALNTSIVRLVTRYILQSASYTTFFAIVSAVVQVSTDPDDPSQYDMSFITWLPCSVLYAFSLFTTLTIPDRVTVRLGDFGQDELEGHCEVRERPHSFTSHHSGAYCLSIAPAPIGKTALEGMITKPGEPAWEQTSTSFLGVKVGLKLHDDDGEFEDRPSFRRANSSTV